MSIAYRRRHLNPWNWVNCLGLRVDSGVKLRRLNPTQALWDVRFRRKAGSSSWKEIVSGQESNLQECIAVENRRDDVGGQGPGCCSEMRLNRLHKCLPHPFYLRKADSSSKSSVNDFTVPPPPPLSSPTSATSQTRPYVILILFPPSYVYTIMRQFHQ